MNFQELKLNRFGYKASQTTGTADSQQLTVNNRGIVPLPADNIKEANDNSKNARQVITGTVITSCFIQTSALPNRVEMSGNDIRLFDDSDGGTGAINGDTASMRFIRSDKQPGDLVLQKRHGVNDDRENVFEMFYSAAAAGGQKNYIFIGRQGDATLGSFTDQNVLHGIWDVRAEVNRVFKYESRPTIYTADYNKLDNAKQGVLTTIAGEGDDGVTGMGFLVELLTFSNSPGFTVGSTITGNSTGATAKIILKVDTNHYYCNHTNNIAFNPATDNACTSSGAGGPGDLSATQWGNYIVLYVTDSLDISVGSNMIPDANGVYNIGSPSFKFNNIYGSIVACPLPTVLNALDTIRKIPDPVEVGERGHFGDGLYFDNKTFPDEVLHDTPEGRDIEHTRMIGLLMQAVRELTEKVDLLEEKLSKIHSN